jgi:hypothetical protein
MVASNVETSQRNPHFAFHGGSVLCIRLQAVMRAILCRALRPKSGQDFVCNKMQRELRETPRRSRRLGSLRDPQVIANGFAPTTTLGCGSWGGNSISENLDYKHLMNVSRIGKVITNRKVPSDDEIWAP